MFCMQHLILTHFSKERNKYGKVNPHYLVAYKAPFKIRCRYDVQRYYNRNPLYSHSHTHIHHVCINKWYIYILIDCIYTKCTLALTHKHSFMWANNERSVCNNGLMKFHRINRMTNLFYKHISNYHESFYSISNSRL